MAALNYAQAGVDREAADRLVEKISGLAKSTLNRRVKTAIGGYASLFELDKKRWLAASTDGVGTKLKLAFASREHRTVGIDLVAMSVNDLICVGAEPLFFLDYFATGKLDPGIAEQVLQGIVEGCRQASCALVGGETAEMPDIYHEGEYDLAGFAVGTLDPKHALPRQKDVKPGDTLIGIGSSGVHSNGFSLLRKLIPTDGDNSKIIADLMTPTKIYVRSLMPLIRSRMFKGLAHITGSGFLNVPRISDKVSYDITLPPARELPRIYDWVRERSGLGLDELAQTFNMGIGMVAVVDPRKAAQVMKTLRARGERVWVIGNVVRRQSARGCEVKVRDESGETVLRY